MMVLMIRLSTISLALLCQLIIFCDGDKGTSPEPEAAPQITQDPAVSNIQSNSATITWLTDVESTTTVRYGFVSGQLIFRDSSAARVTTHTRNITGLRSNSDYYFRVSSTTSGGMAMSDELTFRTGLGVTDLGPAAWAEYKAGNYWQAIDLFKQLLQLVPTSFEACNGLGWCYATGTVDSLQAALDYFRSAIGLNAYLPDAYAGRGFVHLALNYYAFAIDDLNRVLAERPNYVFAHNSEIDVKDIRLGLAEAYFYTQNFTSAQAQVNILAPGNGLDANDPATWVVDGVIYASYAEALLVWIEKLKTVTA